MCAKLRGFTLIELMAALAILALLLLLGMPSFTSFMRNSEVRSTAESLINGLRAASAEATRRNAKVVWTMAGGGDSSWAMNTLTDTDTDCTNLVQPPLQQYAKAEASKHTTVTLTPGKTSVCFNGLGRIINQGTPDDHIQQIDITSVAAGEARPLRIIVDDAAPADPTKPRGLRMCDPDPALLTLSPPDPRAC